MMGKAFGNIKALILESCVISQVFVTLCNLYNFQALRCSYIFYQHNGCAVSHWLAVHPIYLASSDPPVIGDIKYLPSEPPEMN